MHTYTFVSPFTIYKEFFFVLFVMSAENFISHDNIIMMVEMRFGKKFSQKNCFCLPSQKCSVLLHPLTFTQNFLLPTKKKIFLALDMKYFFLCTRRLLLYYCCLLKARVLIMKNILFLQPWPWIAKVFITQCLLSLDFLYAGFRIKMVCCKIIE